MMLDADAQVMQELSVLYDCVAIGVVLWIQPGSFIRKLMREEHQAELSRAEEAEAGAAEYSAVYEEIVLEEETWVLGWDYFEEDETPTELDAPLDLDLEDATSLTRRALEFAVAREDYEEAARLKARLEQIAQDGPRIPALRTALDRAVAREDYQEASRLKVELDHECERFCAAPPPAATRLPE